MFDYESEIETAQDILFYNIPVALLNLLSITVLFIHIFKFFRSPSSQSLANKNLTLYCFFLLLNILISILIMVVDQSVMTAASLENEDVHTYVEVSTWSYLGLTVAFLKLIIALDICLCFQKVATRLQKPTTESQNKKFLVYCISGTGIPLLWTYFIVFGMQGSPSINVFRTLAVIRIARLIPVIGAFWYIRSASINKNELWTNFPLHIRLLTMIGGISALLSVGEIFAMKFMLFGKSIDHKADAGYIVWMMHTLGATLEGVLIGILFTFRKDTFKSISSSMSS